jgi:hypothetical protein
VALGQTNQPKNEVKKSDPVVASSIKPAMYEIDIDENESSVAAEENKSVNSRY